MLIIWEKIKNRYFILNVLLIVLAVLFVSRLFYLQMVRGEEYRELSERKLTNNTPLKAPRGEILDRYGRPLISNQIGFSVQIQKTDISSQELNDMLLRIVRIFVKEGISYIDSLPISYPPYTFIFEDDKVSNKQQKEIKWKEINKIDIEATAEQTINFLKEKYQITEEYDYNDIRPVLGIRYEMESRGFSRNSPFTYATEATPNIVSQLKEQHLDFPGVNVIKEPVREYVNGELAAHILGRVAIIYKEEYDKLKSKGYGMNDFLGKEGMEKVLEEYLRGKDGSTGIAQDDEGNLNEVIKPPVPGNYALLTIDAELQKVAEESLKNTIISIREKGMKDRNKSGADAESGAVVAMDVNSGEILAMATYPTYDPRRFDDEYFMMYNDPLKPMWNRAIGGAYAPGSTFKMMTAIAALEAKIVTPADVIRDEGIYKQYAPSYQPVCWIWAEQHRTHGLVNAAEALRVSCNYYFYDIGRRLTIDKLVEYSKQFGLGELTGIELTGESPGILASRESKKKLMDETWYPGDTLGASIGQSFHMFTPIQLASYVSTIANGGTRYKAHLLKSVRSNKEGKIIKEFQPEKLNVIKLEQANWKAVMEGMRSVTEDGTASQAFKDFPISVGGKTGTASVPRGTANGIFVAFAPYENPQIAVVVVVEHGAHGNYTAPVARDIFATYMGLNKQIDQDMPSNSLIR